MLVSQAKRVWVKVLVAEEFAAHPTFRTRDLGFTSRASYLMPDYLRNKLMDLLISDHLSAADFNDDTLGRSLENLYTSGVSEVFAGVATTARGKRWQYPVE